MAWILDTTFEAWSRDAWMPASWAFEWSRTHMSCCLQLVGLVEQALLLAGHQARLRDARKQLLKALRVQDQAQAQRRPLVLEAGNRSQLHVIDAVRAWSAISSRL
jgi:hypothetical protein